MILLLSFLSFIKMAMIITLLACEDANLGALISILFCSIIMSQMQVGRLELRTFEIKALISC